MLTFRTERWAAVADEIAALTPAHWDMLALHKDLVPLAPNWELYANAGDRLHVTTARTEHGELAGYYVSFVDFHPHYRTTLFGMVDAYWLSPVHRTPTAGMELFAALEEQMRARGAKVLITTTKAHQDISLILERCGFELAGKTYTKHLGA